MYYTYLRRNKNKCTKLPEDRITGKCRYYIILKTYTVNRKKPRTIAVIVVVEYYITVRDTAYYTRRLFVRDFV